ncbi:MAG: HAD family hydrolase [Selenomonadaceae bacterium]|nr:HAD family hydrolase [Selenomonadaceae bacterium]
MIMSKAVLFDRDGTINVEVGYLSNFDQFRWIDGAIDAIKFCNRNGYLAIVVTNQSGVARGYYTEADVVKLHNRINEELAKHGAHIDDFFYCPHHPNGVVERYAVDCQCRKPKPQLILDACRKYSIDKSQSIMIGDAQRDVDAANNAGVRGVLFDGVNLLHTLKSALNIVNDIWD